jgi:hypothetical protein
VSGLTGIEYAKRYHDCQDELEFQRKFILVDGDLFHKPADKRRLTNSKLKGEAMQVEFNSE